MWDSPFRLPVRGLRHLKSLRRVFQRNSRRLVSAQMIALTVVLSRCQVRMGRNLVHLDNLLDRIVHGSVPGVDAAL
jgi:hypothetical protein